MRWKNLPSWVKGAIIGGGFQVALLTLAHLVMLIGFSCIDNYHSFCQSKLLGSYWLSTFISLYLFPWDYLGLLEGIYLSPFSTLDFLTYFFYIIVSCAIGTLLGWIIGKRKSKKQSKKLNKKLSKQKWKKKIIFGVKKHWWVILRYFYW